MVAAAVLLEAAAVGVLVLVLLVPDFAVVVLGVVVVVSVAVPLCATVSLWATTPMVVAPIPATAARPAVAMATRRRPRSLMFT